MFTRSQIQIPLNRTPPSFDIDPSLTPAQQEQFTRLIREINRSRGELDESERTVASLSNRLQHSEKRLIAQMNRNKELEDEL